MKKKIGLTLMIGIFALTLTGCVSSDSYESTGHHKLGQIEETPTTDTVVGESFSKELTIYTADKECNYLVAQTISVLNAYTPKEIIENVISKNSKCFDKDVKVLSVNIENNIAYIDMNDKFETPNTSSSAIGRMKIYSIVNSLCSIKELAISKVVFTIEGKKVDCISQFDNSVPFEYDAELLAPSQE